VDMADTPDQNGQMRPYWVAYQAEQIIDWQTRRVGGDEILSMVRLSECVDMPDPKDPWVVTHVAQIRVLALDDKGLYTVTKWQPEMKDGVATDKWEIVEGPIYPKRRGVSLTFIPFVFLNPTSTEAEPEKPPLLDLVDVNLSDYRTNADLEHGLHHVGTPSLVITGMSAQGIVYGPSNAIVLDNKDADAKILQVNGEMFGALERASERKRKLMATLGARLLEEQQGSGAETATAVGMRHSGEHATLRTIAQVIEQGLSMVWRFHAWWVGVEATPSDVKASVELSKDFWAVKMSPDELKALMLAWQGDGMSWETLWFNMQKGQLARPGVSAEDERKQIEEENAVAEPPEAEVAGGDGAAGMPPGRPEPPDPAKVPAMQRQMAKVQE
jgi:hypothetical protein